MSVRVSVCLSNAWIVTKRNKKSVQIFTPYERLFSRVSAKSIVIVKSIEILFQTDRVGAKSPIFSRYSLVAVIPSEKIQLTLIRNTLRAFQ